MKESGIFLRELRLKWISDHTVFKFHLIPCSRTVLYDFHHHRSRH